ncbi:MAG TPA: glycoside hydrolase family 3 N-terminal domain-containing protein [Nocardioides sp.]
MNVERLALQVQLAAFPGTTLAPEAARLLDEGLGGLCLFGSNTAAGPDQIGRLTQAIHEVAPGAVVAIDEEGGDVTRVHAATGSPVLGPAALGVVDDLDLTRATGRAVGTELAALGVDLDLGPVADVNSNPDNPVIGVRSFGSDPARVAAHVAAWVVGLQESGVAACAKHFPGHGDTAQDSHLDLPTVDADRATLVARDLLPFAAAVDAGAAAVMTSHLLVPAIDATSPATLSRPVLSLLSELLGFQGVLVSDALDMAGASGAGRGIQEAAVQALLAGCDLLCLGADKDADLVRSVQSAIVAAVGSGRLPEERLADAAARVTRIAGRARPKVDRELDHELDHDRQLAGARAAIGVEGELPALEGAVTVRVDTTPNIAVGVVPWGLPADLVVDPGSADPLAGLPRDGSAALVVQVRDGHRQPGVRAVLAELGSWQRPMVVVEWGWPGASPSDGARICTYGASLPSRDAVAELLAAAGWGGGRRAAGVPAQRQRGA